MPLPIALRILLDVLAGLEELHRLRDAQGKALCMVHGEVAPGNVLVQTDGQVRLKHYCRVKWVALKVAASVGYLAPELLLQEGEPDHRADLYSAGAILFEAIAGKSPFPNGKVSTVIRALTSGSIPHLEVPRDASWVAPLVDITSRAMAVDPIERFDSAAQMAERIQQVASNHVASVAQVAAWVARLAGAKILERRNALTPGAPRTRSRPPSADHGKPKRVSPRGPSEATCTLDASPAPVPMPSLAMVDQGAAPVCAGKPNVDIEVPMPVLEVGEPSKDEAKSVSPALPPPAPAEPPVPGPAPSPPNRPLEPAIPAPLPEVLRGGDAHDDALSMEPVLAESSDSLGTRRWVWPIVLGAAVVLSLLVVGIWAIGAGESGEPSAVEPEVAALPAEAPHTNEALPSASVVPASSQQQPATTQQVADAGEVPHDAEVSPDAESSLPKTPGKSPRPSSRPRPAKTYDPMGI